MNTIEIEKTCHELLIAVKAGLSVKRDSEVITEAEYVSASSFIDKLIAGDFYMGHEAMHNVGDSSNDSSYPDEFLMRAWDKSTTPMLAIAPFAPITIIGKCDLHAFLDKMIILRSVEQALREELKNISINTSAKNMGDAQFWRGIKNALLNFFNDDLRKINLTFEITEDDLAAGPCFEALQEMKEELGCKFAIDDFYHDYARCLSEGVSVDSYDWERLQNLTHKIGIIDIVKLDGYSVRKALDPENPLDLTPVIAKIKSLCPNAKIIAEQIRTPEEAAFFRDNYPDVSAVQGMHLPHDRKVMRALLDAVAINPKTNPGI